MKRYTLEEYLVIDRWESEREAAQEPHPQTEACLTPTTLDDYQSGEITLDEAQLEHLLQCRRCAVRFGTLAELTLSEVKTKVEKDLARIKISIPPMVTQVAQPQPPSAPSQVPTGAIPAFAGRVLSPRRKSADAAVDAQKEKVDTFIWKRESETVNGWLSFETWDGETFQPHIELKPPPGKTTFLFRCENGAREIPLTIDSDGHSEPCEDVPAESLKDWELIAPDGELEWKAASESPPMGEDDAQRRWTMGAASGFPVVSDKLFSSASDHRSIDHPSIQHVCIQHHQHAEAVAHVHSVAMSHAVCQAELTLSPGAIALFRMDDWQRLRAYFLQSLRRSFLCCHSNLVTHPNPPTPRTC